MTKVRDLTGEVFGRLTVVGPDAPGPRGGSSHWVCRCVCGKTVTVYRSALVKGATRSCGCLDNEKRLERNTKHGLAPRGHRNHLYYIWHNIRTRTGLPSHPRYADYGGRGITMYPAWREDFAAFKRDIEAEIGPRPENPEGWTAPRAYWSLDRIDNDGNYEPGNMRWATPSEQESNKRRKGNRYTVKEMA